ncbi:PHP domain-containing protein [Nakamurella leprariae]|uniref:Polymerase/histidinol phosphatase N-terminal domain-containing protein n=1 Tax=Nakamurella leprariae TaxID=2803911 RepID=A0A938YDJ7_9ACTN|nr:PHP domain-containing protein [Nakamurella leprariae]MBM9467623.1 hypothetical protein [Nakamurella leprariae]
MRADSNPDPVEVTGAVPAPGLRPGLVDLHTHSSWTDGADPLPAMVAAAAAAGLRVLGCSDHVRSSSDWLPEYVAQVHELDRELAERDPAGLRLRCGVETKILDTGGRLDLPALPDGLQYLVVSDHQFPDTDGPVSPRVIAADLAQGRRAATDVLEQLVTATAAAVRVTPLPVVVGHLFSLLPKLGLAESAVPDELLDHLAASCRDARAAVEVNEKWRCPSVRVVRRLQAAGVRLTTGSDAHAVAEVGRRDWVDQVLREVPASASTERSTPGAG